MSKNDTNNNLLLGVIIIMAIIIAVMGFFLGKMSGNTNTVTTGTVIEYEELELVVISDDRDTKSPISEITSQLKELPSISNVNITELKFTDTKAKKIMEDNNIKLLPAILFSTNKFDVSNDPQQLGQNGQPVPKITSYLTKLAGEFYSLPINATFDPFIVRSERGFQVIDDNILTKVKEGGYIKGNKDAKITWLEFSDLECPFCAKLHNSSTPNDLFSKYGDNLNTIFKHFPLGFHANAQIGAEILECLAEDKGDDAYYALIEKSFENKNSNKSFLIDEAIKLGGDKEQIQKCLDESRYTDKVKNQMTFGGETFGVTGTPGNVLINMETGEYEVLSGAYPTDAFIDIIDRLQK